MKLFIAALLGASLLSGAIAPAAAQDPQPRRQLHFHGADLHDGIALIGDEYGVRMVADGTVPHVRIPDNMPPLTLDEMLDRLRSFGLEYTMTTDANGSRLYTFTSAKDYGRSYGVVFNYTLKYANADDKLTQWLQDALPVGTRVLVNPTSRRVMVIGTAAATARAKTLLDQMDTSVVGSAADATSPSANTFYITEPIYVHNVAPSIIVKALGFSQSQQQQAIFGGQQNSGGGGASQTQQIGSLVGDDRSMVIVASGPRDFIAQIKDRVKFLDVPAVQGKFDVEILAVTNSAATQFGNQFGGLNSAGTFTQGVATTSFVNRAIPITLTINALIDNGNAKVLAKTSILAANSQIAHIKSGERYPFPVTDPTTLTVTYQTENIGVIIDVTPIFGDNDVATMLHLEDSELIGTVNGTYPRISENIYDTPGNVRLRYDETLVLGGLMKTTDNVDIQKVPWLSDIPLIGGLFKFKNQTKQDVQLVFMLTPHRDDTK